MKIKWKEGEPEINSEVCSAKHDGRTLSIVDDSCRGVVTLVIEDNVRDRKPYPFFAAVSFETGLFIDVELAKYCAQKIVDEQDKTAKPQEPQEPR